jgi:hypothetical protein
MGGGKGIKDQRNFSHISILTKFGYPLTLVSNQGIHFINEAIEVLNTHFLFQHISLQLTTFKEMVRPNLPIRLLGYYWPSSKWESHIMKWTFPHYYICLQTNFQGGHKSYFCLVGVWIICSNAYQITCYLQPIL